MSGKVVVTGMNIISSLGLDLKSNWENLTEGRSGVRKIRLFDASENITQIAAEIPPEFEEYSRQYIKKRAGSQMTRVTRICFTCAREAIVQSGLNFDTIDKTRCAVILGVVNTGNSSSEKNTTLQNSIFKNMTNAMSAWISL